MRWDDLHINQRVVSLAHLQPFALCYDIAGKPLVVKVEFGLHCFTDDKGEGEPIRFRGEARYFSPERLACSFQLRPFFERRFIDALAVPHYVKNSQRFFCMDLHEYAMFFSLQRSANEADTLKLRVISAYEVSEWGRDTLPRGRPYNVRYILERRAQGLSVGRK